MPEIACPFNVAFVDAINADIERASQYTINTGSTSSGNEGGWLFYKHGDGHFVALVLSARSINGVFIYMNNPSTKWYKIK